MASVTLRLALRNVDGDWLDDPRVIVRLQHTTSGSVPAVVSFAPTPGIQQIEVDVADGQYYRVEITPTRYAAFVKDWRADSSGAATITATLARRSSQWEPSFDIWAGLPAHHEPLKTLLTHASTVRVGGKHCEKRTRPSICRHAARAPRIRCCRTNGGVD